MFTSQKPIPLAKFESLLLLPTSINIDELIKSSFSYSSEIVPFKLLSLISLITTKLTSYNYTNKRYESHKKINIHSNELKTCCGNKYKVYFDFLFDFNILSSRSPFNNKVVGQTFGYGFKGIYRFSRLKLIRLDNPQPIYYEKKFDSYVKKFEKILYNVFDRTKFSMDFDMAEERLFDKYLGNITFPLNSNDTSEWERYSAYHGALKQIVKFFNGEHTFTRKTKPTERKPSGRFYSPLTFLNKVVRGLLYYEGEKLRQLDVKNMFPYLLSQYLKGKANLDSQRVERLQNCPAFMAKYKLNTVSYKANQWSEQYLKERNGILLFSKPILEVTNGRLVQQGYNKYKYFFLEKPKSLFQYSDNHFQQHNKKFYYPFLRNTQREKRNHNDWEPKSERKTPRDIYPNGYNQTKGLFANLNLDTLYTETYKGLNNVNGFNSSLKNYSNYISKKVLETLMNKEILKFNALSIEGVIYDHFIDSFKSKVLLTEWATDYQKVFNKEYNHLYEQDRDLTKTLFISMLYARNNQYKKEQEIFKSEFPIIYDLIREKKKGNHKIITHELFDMEAEIIVDTVARDLLKKKVPTFTIHDCIVVQEENIEISELKMKETFISRFGSCPQIKLE